MSNRFDTNRTILAPGVAITTSAASANATLPNCINGNVPRHVRVSASVAACVRMGIAGVVATAADTVVQPGDALHLTVPDGITTIAAIQLAAAGTVQISALEDA